MMYEVRIVELVDKGEKYPSNNTVYEQKIENLDVGKVVLFLNTNERIEKGLSRYNQVSAPVDKNSQQPGTFINTLAGVPNINE